MMTKKATRQPPGSVTKRLRAWQLGDRAAFDEVIDEITPRLRLMARGLFRKEGRKNVLQPTALVNELWIKLVGEGEKASTKKPYLWKNRSHFFGACGMRMKHLLVEEARRRNAKRRGGDNPIHVPADDILGKDSFVNVLILDDLLARVRQQDERHYQTFVLYYFSGLTSSEIAEQLGVSVSSVKNYKRFVKAWLRRELREKG